MKEQFLAYLELKQDFLFDKIPTSKVMYYIEESLTLGYTKAKELQGSTIQELINDNNIKLELIDGDGEFFKVKLRAQFEFDPKGNHKIIVYKKSIQEFAEICGLSEADALDIHLAHELFHYYEFVDKQSVPEILDSVENLNFLFIKKTAHINRTSEIAAHAFAKQILSLENLPNYYDYQYLINSGKLPQTTFDQWYLNFEGMQKDSN